MKKVKKYISDQDPIITDAISKAGLDTTVGILLWEYSYLQNKELTDRINRLESLFDSLTTTLEGSGMNGLADTINELLKK